MNDRPSVLIATPAYGGLVTTRYLDGLLETRERLAARGIRSGLYTISNESLITRARNACLAHFLAGRIEGVGFTHLLFIDADIGFSAADVERLLDADVPIVGAGYPLKGVDWSRAAAVAAEPGGVSAEAVEAAAHYYAVRVSIPAERRGQLVAAHAIGTGFMCLRRDAVDTLIADPERAPRYVNDVTGYERPGNGYVFDGPLRFYALFDTGVDPGSGHYLSEDYLLCAQWRALGGKVWLHTGVRLTHTGNHVFRGDVTRWLHDVGAID